MEYLRYEHWEDSNDRDLHARPRAVSALLRTGTERLPIHSLCDSATQTRSCRFNKLRALGTLFGKTKTRNPSPFNQFRSLAQKTPGWGGTRLFQNPRRPQHPKLPCGLCYHELSAKNNLLFRSNR